MKFNTLITTFKNGLCSPLVRGRKDIDGIESSAEEFTNNYIDSIGATRRRMGTRASSSYISNADKNDTVQNFAFKLLGQSFMFSFNSKYAFNEMSPLNYLSQFLTIDNSNAFSVQVFGADSVGPNTLPQVKDFNSSLGGVNSGLVNYLRQNLTIIQYTQISDRTVVFTTNSFSFAVSLMDIEWDTGALGKRPLRMFIMYPYFMNLAQFVANGMLSSGSTKCPIYCTNYPFNFPNTNTSKLIFVSEEAGQTGSATTSGVLTTSGNKFVAHVDIPYSLIPVGASLFNYFSGAFIRVQTQDSKEAVYFLTEAFADVTHSSVLYRRYRAIQTVGGAPSTSGTSVFTISSWYDSSGHPKVTSTYKTRLLFANAGINNASTVYAAAINNVSPFDYQGMMADVLIQDNGTSDASGMKYYDSNVPARRGFSLAFSDGEGQEIRWMMSRRRLHLGTSSGEYQITVNTSFTRDSAEQIRFGSINSDFIQPIGGDRKILYCANGGSELRAISVEDRDYESVDIKLNSILSGLPFKVTKLQWFEKLRVAIILTAYKEVYSLSLDSSSQVAGFSLWKFAIDVDDICCTNDTCYIIYKALNDANLDAQDVKAYTILDVEYPVNNDTGVIQKQNHYDNYFSDIFVSSGADIRSTMLLVAKMVGRCQVSAYTNGVEFTSEFIDENSVVGDITVPTEFTTASQVGEFYIIGVKYKSRIRALPQYQGSQYGSAVGDVHRIDRATIQVYDSGMFSYGSEDTALYESEGLLPGQTQTKDYTYELPQNSDREQFYVIETDRCTPLNISGVALRGLSNSGE